MPQPDRPEVDDPRVLALAKARQQMAYENPFNVVCPPWEGLSSDEQQLSLLDARNYLRAALNAGLCAPAVSAGVAAATAAEPLCVCGHPMQQHFEDVCLTECGCNDGLEADGDADLPDRLAAALTARFTELGNPHSRMVVHEQGPDGWPASHPVGPHRVAEVLRELLTADAVLPASVDRADVLREAADAVRDGDLGPRGGMSRDYENGWWNSRAAAEERIRRIAAETPQPEPTPTVADVQHMLTRMRADAATHDHHHLLRLIAKWAASSEGRDVLVDDLIAAGYRLPHACGDCGGVDPGSCPAHPDRAQPAGGAQQPKEARPCCPHCHLPHDLTPGSDGATACAALRASLNPGADEEPTP
jgi:hypothetical protein